jgi:hypothetical protein
MGRRIVHAGAIAIAVLAAAACWENALAPQDASIIFRVVGDPNDPALSVNVFVQDMGPPNNRIDRAVPIGSEARFDDLGAGFDIQVGITGGNAYRCRLASLTGTTAFLVGGSFVDGVHTKPGSVDTVTAHVVCYSGTLDLTVSGLPPSDSALIDFTAASEPQPAPVQSVRVGNGTSRVSVFASQVAVDPQRVISGGRVYQAQRVVTTVGSRQLAAVNVVYAPIVPPQPTVGAVLLRLDGVPVDPGLRLRTFVRDAGATAPLGTAYVPIGQSFTFTPLAVGAPIEVGVDSLANNQCAVMSASRAFSVAGNAATARLTTRANTPDTVAFQMRCRTAVLDVTVAGLPAGDAGSVAFTSAIDTATIRSANGTTRLPMVPNDTIRIVPASVTGSDGRTYTASTATIAAPSRATTAVTVQYRAPAPPPSCSVDRPIAWYTLDATGNDASGNANHGTVVGATAIANRNGIANGALSFDGNDDRVDLGDRFNALALPFSLSMWLYQPLSVVGQYRSIFATDDEPGQHTGVFLELDPNGILLMSYGDGRTAATATRRTIEAATPIPTDAWVHVVATVRGPMDMTLYMNGAAIAGNLSGNGGPIAHSTFPARIGSFSLVRYGTYTQTANLPWAGRLDELRLYDCSLSAGDVTTLFTRP